MTASQEFKLTLLLILAAILIIVWAIITVGYLYSTYTVYKAARRIKRSSDEMRDMAVTWTEPRYVAKAKEDEPSPESEQSKPKVKWEREG